MIKNTSYLRRVLILSSCGLLWSRPALSVTGSPQSLAANPSAEIAGRGDEDQRGNFIIKIHPFVDKSTLLLPTPTALSLTQFSLQGGADGADGFSQRIAALISTYINNPYLQVGSEENVVTSQGPRPVSHRWHHPFQFDGVGLCDISLNSFLLPDGSMALLGTIPSVDADETPVSVEDWPSLASLQSILNSYDNRRFEHNYFIQKSERCYYVRDGVILPSWRVQISSQGLGYEVLLDPAEIYGVHNRYFDLQTTPIAGKIQAYDSNPLDGTLTTYDVDLSDPLLLTNNFFMTNTTSGTTTFARSSSESHSFVYPPTDSRFDEASIFINANKMLNYFKSLGYSWSGETPLVLRVHAVINGNVNNALYEPSRGGLPSISIGDGDGVILKNLSKDADVISHEFGHHVIFSTLQNTSGESLVLHEGLADFFAFSRTGDACLGESVCPTDSTICIVQNKCLRTASNKLMFLSDDYINYGPHQKGQIVSGLLWDLRTSLGADKITPIVFHSINFFTADAGFGVFFTSLLLADQDLNKGANACAIVAAIKARGFSQVIADIDCSNPETWKSTPGSSGTTGSTGTTASGEPTVKVGERKTTHPKCATLVWQGSDHGGPWAGGGMLLVLLVPLLVLAGRGMALRKARLR